MLPTHCTKLGASLPSLSLPLSLSLSFFLSSSRLFFLLLLSFSLPLLLFPLLSAPYIMLSRLLFFSSSLLSLSLSLSLSFLVFARDVRESTLARGLIADAANSLYQAGASLSVCLGALSPSHALHQSLCTKRGASLSVFLCALSPSHALH